ncbi:hypothetical protein DDE82_004954 [Stemphylium lycopersici]|uniref:Uncharacterized protein n=1 Tax=Stemphylium lycopersici TaxID=183478 RepID=A0A364MTZ3_STELY|nr:hypothetical protein DDE83_008249 [Stemphylium lycopersici]RAR03866.1 hypothetical protein DDE82_004954 [Stemphylium lycopersici]
MSEPPSKRRRTNSPEDRASSPLRKPPRRPSFASPTKASLARNYPNLLPSASTPRLSASPKRSARGDVLARGKQARAFVLGDTDAQPGSEQDATPRGQNANSRAAPEDTGNEDSELPATSSQQGLEQDQPLRGILFSSPSKRPPRSKNALAQSSNPKAPAVQSDDITRTVEDGPAEEDTQETAEKRPPPDPEVERRKQEKARLQREVEELESQVSRCVDEIVKEQRRGANEVLQSQEHTSLSNFIVQISGAEYEPEKPPVSSLLCSFLPFAAISVPQPRPKQSDKPVPSHRPVELADPLPYLEMFTSFKFSTQLSLPRNKVQPSSKRVHQKHTIDITGPQKLLTAQVAITIDALATEILDFQLLRISPWAERELGSFIRTKAQDKDLGNASWAIDSYWDIAKKRAQHWHKCETAFSHLLVGRTEKDTENGPRKNSTKSVSRKDLNRHLGRDILVLQDKHILLKLNWRISFDWTGEAQSDVTVETAFPQVWSEADDGAGLKKIPETFNSLVHSLTVPVSEQSKAPDKSFEPIDGFTIKVHYSLQIEVLRGAYALIIGLEWEVEEDSILLWRDQGGWRWSWMR